MAASELMRVSATAAARIKERAARNDRKIVAEMDRIVDAGIAALEAQEARAAKKTAVAR